MNNGLRGYCYKGIPGPRVLCHSLTQVTEVAGKGMGVLQKLKKFRVRVWKCYRTHKSSGYCGTGVQNSEKFRAGTKNAVPVSRVLWYGAYRAYRSSGYGYECRTELTEVPGTGMNVLLIENFLKFFLGYYPGKIPRVWFGTYPTEHNLEILHTPGRQGN